MFSMFFMTVLAFIGTNLDDIFMLTFFFAQATTKRSVRFVVAGQFLGIFVLFFISVLSAFGLSFLPEKYLRFLGLLPIFLGVKTLFVCEKAEEASEETSIGIFSVALVTIAGGADNLGVYIPLFTNFSLGQLVVAGVIFALMTALLCQIGKMLAKLPLLRRFLLRYRRVIVPVVFFALGIYILISGAF